MEQEDGRAEKRKREEAQNPSKKKRGKKIKAKPFTSEIKSRKAATKLIGSYHAILKQIEQLKEKKKQGEISETEYRKRKEELKAKTPKKTLSLTEYQKASSFDTHGRQYAPHKWMMEKLIEENVFADKEKTIQLLEVGALGIPRVFRRKGLEVTAIDLHPHQPEVRQMDFFHIQQFFSEEHFDVLLLSLVVNFVPSPALRGFAFLHSSAGEMLHLANRMLVPQGWLLVVLPLACLSNSRYCTPSLFVELLEALGFTCQHQKESKKLSFFLLRKTTSLSSVYTGKSFPKTLLRQGKSHNNFCVTLISDANH